MENPGALKTPSVPITLVRHEDYSDWITRQPFHAAAWMKANHFIAKPQSHCLIPDENGGLHSVAVGVDKEIGPWAIADLSNILPEGDYRLQSKIEPKIADALMLGWLLGTYRFNRYKKDDMILPTLQPIAGCNADMVRAMSDYIHQARDLINTPANDMGPEELAAACRQAAHAHHATYHEIVGENLLKENYPAIYEVGKASVRAPRLVDMRWGDHNHPKVTLVGKGVCFDSGGLDIKPSSGMRMMKKDMGGAACVLALARMIMHANLSVCLRVLIPAVENSISGNAYRPLDVIRTRKGMTVEVGNTDAEGRLILCDALYEADSEKPDLLIDCATLTGAARTALGTDVAAFFTPDDSLAEAIMRHSNEQDDPLWRLPLRSAYRSMLNSTVADINSAPDSGYAGAITAALYLKEFVTHTTPWAHIDMMAWNLKARPGAPVGGEAMAVRALFAYIKEQFTTK